MRSSVVLVIVCSLEKAHAEEAAELTLLPTTKSAIAGQRLTLGVLMQHRSGYHSYWKHPGDVGVALQIDWQLPDGVCFAGFDWALPERIMMAEFPAHGYTKDALHRAHFDLPASFKYENLTIRGRAHWMSCQNNCQLIHQDIELTIPVAVGTTHTEGIVLDTNLDVSNKLEDRVAQAELLRKDSETYFLRLHLAQDCSEQGVYFFFDSPSIKAELEQTFRWIGKRIIEFELHENEYAERELTKLSGLLFFETSQVYSPVKIKNYENTN